jgi:hypothetical protein
MKRLALLALLLPIIPTAQAWEVGDFHNGMTRSELLGTLKSWNFDKVIELGKDSLLAYDLPDSQAGRRFLFTFCNGKLASFDQEVLASFRNFIVIASNYANLYGNPFEVIPYSKVVASGEKDVLALFWRRGMDFIGAKYAIYSTGEQLSLTWQVNNNCWQAPR